MKKTEINDGRRALIAICSFFTMVIAANVTLVYFAISSNDGLVEDNYYKRGLNYQDEKDLGVRQEKLGWEVDFQKKNSLYSIAASDKDGESLRNAEVKLTFFRPTQSGFDKTFELSENSPGVYEKDVDLSLKGIWDVYIEVRKEKNVWKKKQRITI